MFEIYSHRPPQEAACCGDRRALEEAVTNERIASTRLNLYWTN